MFRQGEPEVHPRVALAMALIGAVLGLLASTLLAGCQPAIACEPGVDSTCPTGLVCDASSAVCVDPNAPAGGGDGDGPCVNGCAQAVLVDNFEGAAALHYVGGALYVGGSTPGRSGAVMARVDPGNGATNAIAGGQTRVSRVVSDASYVYWVNDASDSTSWDDVNRVPLAGGQAERIWLGEGGDEVAGYFGSLGAGGGFVLWANGTEIIRADQSGLYTALNMLGSVIAVSSNDLFVTNATQAHRLGHDEPMLAAAGLTLPGPRDGRQVLSGTVVEPAPGVGFVYWATRADSSAGQQGNLVRMDFDGNSWEIVVEGVDPQGYDDGAEIIAMQAVDNAVYYVTDGEPGAAYRISIGAAAPELLATGDLAGIAVGGGAYYVSDSTAGTVTRYPIP